jgi:thioredoxin-like negative regulator of GroEL
MRAADGIIGAHGVALVAPFFSLLRPLLVTALLIASAIMSSSTLGAAPPPAGNGWVDDLAAAQSRAQSEHKAILVDLWADWCTWCKRLEKDVFSTPAFTAFAKDYVLLRIDTEDGGSGTRLMEDFEIDNLPTTLILSHDLVKMGELQGYLPADAYVQSLQLEAAMYASLIKTYDEHQRGGAKTTGAATGAAATAAAATANSTMQPIQTLADDLHQRHDGARASVLYQELIDRGGDNPEENAWNQYYYADSLRLAHDLAAARRAAATARKAATKVANEEMVERIDLLSFYLARDANACAEAKQALASFLTQHPNGVLVDLAHQEQDRIKSGEGCS